MTGYKLLDSSVWIAYFTKQMHFSLIESGRDIIISSLSFFEVGKKLLIDKIPRKVVQEHLKFMQTHASTIEVTFNIVEQAIEVSLNHNLAMADSIIYSSALLNKAELITLDNDFRGLPNTLIL